LIAIQKLEQVLAGEKPKSVLASERKRGGIAARRAERRPGDAVLLEQLGKDESEGFVTARKVAWSPAREVSGTKSPPPPDHLLWDRDRVYRALLECVQTVTLVVAAEAYELVRQDKWTVVDVNREVEKFERNFADELGRYDRPGRVLPSLTRHSMSDRCSVLLAEVALELHGTPKWHQHLAELRAIHDQQAAKKTKPIPAAAIPSIPTKHSRINGRLFQGIRLRYHIQKAEVGKPSTIDRIERDNPTVKAKTVDAAVERLASVLSKKDPDQKITYKALLAKLQQSG
jgi:hypothetical protein